MFRGVSELTIDEKGRVAMPTRYRHDLSEMAENQMVITIDTEERCLLIYPLPQWEVIEKQVEALPSFNKKARKVQRLLIGHATEMSLDSHSRFLIPPPLRDYAGLDKRIVLIGQGKKFEIWSESHWMDSRETWITEDSDDDGDTPDSLLRISL